MRQLAHPRKPRPATYSMLVDVVSSAPVKFLNMGRPNLSRPLKRDAEVRLAVAPTLWEAHDAKFFSDNFRREISLACKFPVRLQRTVPHLVGLAIINDYDPAGRHP
jgi:hypothetical protein